MGLLSFLSRKTPKNTPPDNREERIRTITPGRDSVPEDSPSLISAIKGMTSIVTPSFRTEVIPLIRNLYKINPDVSITLQDMMKLVNTGHKIDFPNNTDEEADKMRQHLKKASNKWSRYSAGIDGLINRFISQTLVGGALSIEAVPNEKLDGIETVLFLKPENIVFKRENNGVYSPYQKNLYKLGENSRKEDYIKLNPETYFYIGIFNDTDEPYGIPPFMSALDSIKGQADMKDNFKHIMELVGMVGFVEALMEKPDKRADESVRAYESRLSRTLKEMKRNIKNSLRDGVVTGYKDDHEFKLNATTKELGNMNIPWQMNQQSVANGLGVNGSIIGLNASGTEGGQGITLSKLISQLKNLQLLISFGLEKLYNLELLLAGFNSKGISITWGTSTISDEVKVQQARQYKIQNLNLLYTAGIISQNQYAWELGYDSPDRSEPRVPLEDTSDPQEATKKKQRQDDKNQSARRTRDKNNPAPKRGDQNTKTR